MNSFDLLMVSNYTCASVGALLLGCTDLSIKRLSAVSLFCIVNSGLFVVCKLLAWGSLVAVLWGQWWWILSLYSCGSAFWILGGSRKLVLFLLFLPVTRECLSIFNIGLFIAWKALSLASSLCWGLWWWVNSFELVMIGNYTFLPVVVCIFGGAPKQKYSNSKRCNKRRSGRFTKNDDHSRILDSP